MTTNAASNDQAAGATPENLVDDGLATVPEAAEFLRLSCGTVYNLMERGELRYCKIGKNRRIPWVELKRLAAASLVGPGA
jgi:excisionase family DNA binding protein